MKTSHTKIARTMLYLAISMLILAGGVLTALAAAGELQTAQDLFTPASTPGSLAPSQDQTATRYVEVNISLLDEAVEGDAIGLNLYEGVYYTAILERKETAAPDGYAWVGRLEEVEQSQVILVVGGGQAAGNITSPQGFYQVRYAGDGVHAIYTIDQATFPNEAPPIPVDLPVVEDPNEPEAADLCTSIDVMVVWTPAARSAAGGTTAMQNLVNLAVVETNQSYVNSNMTQRINLAHSQEVSYTESGDFGTDLGRLAGTSDGYIDNVHSLRNTYYADLVSMFIEGTQYCGIGYMMNTVSHSFESSAFTVVARNCATGYYSFAHEMGHNEGANHDWYVETSTTPYAYAHGYVYTPGRWRTIMAYNNQCADSGYNCTRLQYWSNPSITYGGQPMGVPVGSFHPADNHLALNNTCSTVANFRDRPDAPGAFNKTSPANGLTSVSLNPSLSWGTSSDATSYAYCIDTSNNNTCNTSWVSTGSGTSVGLSGLAASTTYYWHVRSSNGNGTTYSNTDTWWHFTTSTTVPGPVVVDDIFLDDDNEPNSVGNNNQSADCGELIELDAYLRNNGSLSANGVSATISTSDPYVLWPYNTSSYYGDIASGAVLVNLDDFDFMLANDTPDGHLVHFDLNITASNGGPWAEGFDVPVACRPEIGVDPGAFTFHLHPGSTASKTLTIENPGGALYWNQIVGVNPLVVGQWALYYDWFCSGMPGAAVNTFNANHTFTTSQGSSGTWSLVGNRITWVFSNGTTYRGWVAGEYMAGTMLSFDDSAGCWHAERVFADEAPLVEGGLTESGEPAAQPGATDTFTPADFGKVQKVSFDPGFTPEPVSGFDQSTGAEVVNAPHVDLSGDSALAGGGNVLWDLTHGVYLGYEPTVNYSSLVTLLNGAGFDVYTTSSGVNNLDLSPYHILVVNLGSNWNSAYTPAEVEAIKAFVFNGGGLVVLGDNPGTPNSYIQPASQAFGTTTGASYLQDTISNFAGQPIFAGISQIQYVGGGELVTMTMPASLVAWDPGNKGAATVAAYGGGKVLALGDINLWDNWNIANANNQQFALNAFTWLSRWLTVSPNYGWTSPGGNSILTVSVDSTGLSYGSYFGGLAILSNAYAPGKSPLIVPVTLVVYEDMFELPIIIR